MQILKYSTFITKKMKDHQVLSTFLADRTEFGTGLLDLIQKQESEPALLLSLQLLSDMIVHCSEYLPTSHLNIE